ncbi:MAG: beta-propeller fold lactonase family protein [Candidatus Competibacteraceae bacterium]|nr:beta-propeller fold lactonase family protein [Candidatus Competibacteraceae bacterium]
MIRPIIGSMCAALLIAAPAFSPVFAKDTGYLFVSSEKDNVVTVLDGSSYAVVKQIRTAARPRHLQFNADHSQIYAACGDGSAIDIIDIAKLEVVDRIGPIDDPEAFDLSSDGKTMYISLEDAAALGALDLDVYFAEREGMPELTFAEPSADDAELGDDDDDDDEEDDDDNDGEEGADDELLPGMKTVAVGAEPEGVLVSPDGKTVYVTSEVANIVHVIDTDSFTISKNLVVGNRPRRFALTPDGNELWVSNELSGSVSVVDRSNYEVIQTIEFKPKGFRPEEVTPVGITMTADGATAYVALGRANHVAVVDVASREIQDYILVGNRAWNTILNRDGTLLYVANGLSDDVSIIDTERRKVIKSVPVGRVPYMVLIDD